MGRGAVLELFSDPLRAERKDFNNSRELSVYLKRVMTPPTRPVIILEGMARNYVEVLGSYFNMDLVVFANQKRPDSWESLPESFCIERTGNLPSLNDPRRSFMIRYPEPRHFLLMNGRTQMDNRDVRDVDGHPQVNIFRRNRELYLEERNKWGFFHNIGIVCRAASFWSRNMMELAEVVSLSFV
jgi:hypothetical protein